MLKISKNGPDKRFIIRKDVINEQDACIIIDMQNDFMDPEKGTLYVQGMPFEVTREELIMNILDLCALPFGEIDISEDMHFIGNVEFPRHGIHCLAGTWGQLYISALLEIYRKAHRRITKGTEISKDGYSVKSSDDFEEHIRELQQKEIRRIFICGVAYNYCVCQSALAYVEKGFEVYVVRNATRSVPPPYGEHPEVIDERLRDADVKLAYLE
jgi:nicotinamidase/pyrazinamidase